MHIKKATRFFDLINLKTKSYTGVKINARRIPKIIASKIGFNKRKERTAKTAKTIKVIIFLKYSLSIIYLLKKRYPQFINLMNVKSAFGKSL